MPRQPGSAQRTTRSFAEVVPELLAEQGLPITALAKAVAVSSSHLSRALRGRDYKAAGPELARDVAVALGKPPDYFPETREAEVIARIRSDAALRDELYDRWLDDLPVAPPRLKGRPRPRRR